MAEFNLQVAGIVWVLILTLVFLAMFFASRYYKFKTNEYVIHLRSGKVKSAGRGGSVIKLPLVDEIVVIPTTTRKTLLNAQEKIISREFQNVKITAILYWRVSDPEVAFNAVSWNPRSEDYIEEVLKTATEAIIRTTCASLEVEKILRERIEIIKMITDQLLKLTKDWGIIIESLEIIEAMVLDQDLKANMETVKKIGEQQKARLATANAQEIYRLREVEVSKSVGIAEIQQEQQIELNRKEKDIRVVEQERKRIEIAADTARIQKVIEAQADAESNKVQKIADAEAEAERTRRSMQAQADGKRVQLEANAQGMKAQFLAEADGIRQKALAEAEGIRAKGLAEAEALRKKVEAMASVDENYLANKFIETLPAVFANLKPEKMIVVGQGNDGFNSMVSSIVPFMELLPMISTKLKKGLETITNAEQTSSKQPVKTNTSPAV